MQERVDPQTDLDTHSVKTKGKPKEKEKEHSVENVITVESQGIQPSSAQNRRNLIMTVTTVARRVTRHQNAEHPKVQEREVKREEKDTGYTR